MHDRCDMTVECDQPVTHLDQDGFVYCEAHGLSRREYQPCRKMRPYEVRRIQRGQQITHY